MFFDCFNSLENIAEKEIREWQQNNKTFRQFRYGFFQGNVINASEQLIRHTLGVFLLVSLLSLLTWQLREFEIFASSPIFSDFKDARDYHVQLLTLQATLAALTYPIVIGLVGIFLQGRQSAKARLKIYLSHSAALLAGLSSLFLVLAMTIQYGLNHLVPVHVLVIWTWVDMLWFIVNLTGTIYFLYQTIEFIRPEKQAEIIKRYGLNIAWSEQLKRTLKCHFLWDAPRFGFLPKSIEGGPQVLLHSLWRDEGEELVYATFKHPRFFVDVRFRPLNWIVDRWIRRSKDLINKSNATPGTENVPKLFFPLFPDELYKGRTVICRQDGGAALKWWEQSIIRWCFSFTKKVDNQRKVDLDHIFEDIENDVLTAIDRRNLTAYKDSMHLLDDFCITLIKASTFITSTGVIDNYANVSNHLDRRADLAWLRYYREVSERSAHLIHENDEYFEIAAYVPDTILPAVREEITDEIGKNIIKLLGPLLFYRLGDWWVRRIEEAGTMSHDPCNGAALRPPYHGIYEDVLIDFTGAWESLLYYILSSKESKTSSWQQFATPTGWLITHLDQTLKMLAESVKRGDTQAAEWMADTAQKWLGRLSYNMPDHSYYFRNTWFVHIELLNLSWSEVQKFPGLQSLDQEHMRDKAPGIIFHDVIRNYWIDSCCLVIYSLILWGKTPSSGSPLALDLAKKLLNGTTLKEGGEHGQIKPIESLRGLFGSILRQQVVSRDYNNRLDNLMEIIQPSFERRMVPGRVYSGVGTDLNSFRDVQVVLLCCKATSDWSPEGDFTSSVLSLASRDDAIARSMIDYLQQINSRLQVLDISEWRDTFIYLRGIEAEGSDSKFIESKDRVKKLIDYLIGQLNNLRDETIRTAGIDDDRRKAIAKFASESAFDTKTGSIPVSLFRDVEFVSRPLNERHLRIKDFSKGQLTSPLMDQLPINEAEYFEATTRNYVAGFAMESILSQVEVKIVNASTPGKYWEQLKKSAEELSSKGLYPVLLLNSVASPAWINDWLWPIEGEGSRRPDDLRIEKHENESSSQYIAHFNEIAVYTAPIAYGSSYICAKEVFKKISFTKYGTDSPIKVSWEQGEKPSLGDLILEWGMMVELEPYTITKLIFAR